MKSMRRLLVGVVTAATLVSCGGSSSDSGTPDKETTTVNPGEFNDADVMFAQMMIPHHEQAIELSDIALDPSIGASERVRALATKIQGGQDPEIQTMTGLLTRWNQSLTMDGSMDHGDMMDGMLTADDIATLSALRGPEFDRAWMEAMIAHHEGAITMAQTVLKDGSNGEVRALANAVVAAQTAEIAEMRALLQ